jgi:hypothetical protein
MIKTKTTKEAIRKNFANVYAVGYCELFHLLNRRDPAFYNSGVCGWNWDAYIASHDAVIITGYSNFVGQYVDDQICKSFNAKAKAVKENHKLTVDEQNELLRSLLDEFIETAKSC